MKLNLAGVMGIGIGWALSQATFADGISPCVANPGGPMIAAGGGMVMCTAPCTGSSATTATASSVADSAVTYPGTDLVFSVVTNGDGTYSFSFSNPSNLDLSYITSVTIDDVDNDGMPDLILGVNSAAAGGAGMQVLVNDGTGSGIVTYQATLAMAAAPVAVVAADVNDDGWDDIVASSGSADSVDMFINDGNDDFESAAVYPTGAYAGTLTAQDLSGDGAPDLLLNSNGSLTLLLNDGTGSFGPGKSYPAGDFSTVTTGDVIGDGETDLLLYGGKSGVGVMLPHGDGTYNPVAWTPVLADAVDIDDFNNDGVPDLAAASTSAGTVTVLPGNGDGTFGTPASYQANAAPVGIWSFDQNGDGWEDIVTDNQDGTQSLFLNNGDGSFAPAQAYTPAPVDVCFFMAPGSLAKGSGAQVQFQGKTMIVKGLTQSHRLGSQSASGDMGTTGGGSFDLLCLALLTGVTALRRRR